MKTFLDDDEIATLTGRKIKSLQIAALRKMGIPFYVNATGHPVVTRSVIEKPAAATENKPIWSANVLRA